MLSKAPSPASRSHMVLATRGPLRLCGLRLAGRRAFHNHVFGYFTNRTSSEPHALGSCSHVGAANQDINHTNRLSNVTVEFSAGYD